MIQKSTVIPSSLMVLYVPINGSTEVVEVVGPDLLFLCPGYLVHNIFLYNIHVGRRRWWWGQTCSFCVEYLVNNIFLYMILYVGQWWWWWGQTCSISYFLLMGGRGCWTWAAPGLKWPIPAGLKEFEREVPFGNNSLPYMSSSSSFACSQELF